MRYHLFILVTLITFIPSFLDADSRNSVREIHYSYGENHKALLMLPESDLSVAPIIIFNYHEDVDRSKFVRVRRDVQDFYPFMDKFRFWGAITIVPMRRDIDLDAITSAIRFARSMKYGDKSRIYVIGYSEAAMLSLLSVSYFPYIKGLVMITPRNIHETGAYSLPEVMRKMPRIKTKILEITSGGLDSGIVHLSQVYKAMFTQQRKDLTYREYNEIERWFWNPENEFMTDIKAFIYNDFYKDVPKEAPVKPKKTFSLPNAPHSKPATQSKPAPDKPLYFPFVSKSV